MWFTKIAPFVALLSLTVAAIACVLAARSTSQSLRLAARMRSTLSMQGELIEIRDYLAKVDAWMKRINAREQTQAARAARHPATASAEPTVSSSPVSAKDELRRRIGLVPGHVAPHK